MHTFSNRIRLFKLIAFLTFILSPHEHNIAYLKKEKMCTFLFAHLLYKLTI